MPWIRSSSPSRGIFVIFPGMVLALALVILWGESETQRGLTANAESSRSRELATITISRTGASGLPRTVEQNSAQPLALASGDFDEDGIPDLVVGLAGPAGGWLSLYRGDEASIYPNTPAARTRREVLAASGALSAFLPAVRICELPAAPDFIATGDFDADGHLDVVIATRASSVLYWLAGDGRGNFSIAQPIELTGQVTALITGEINRADGLTDVVVGITGSDGPRVLVFESPEGALRTQPEAFALPATATALALGRVEADYLIDLAVAAGRELIIVHGRDRKLSLDRAWQASVPSATISRRSFPSPLKSIAIGNFTGQHRNQIAALTEDGTIRLVNHKQETTSNRQLASQSKDQWSSELLTASLWPQATHLICARVSGRPSDDLLVMEAAGGRLQILARETERRRDEERGREQDRSTARVYSSFNVEGELVAVLPMRLNADALSDLVILKSRPNALAVEMSRTNAIFSVTNTDDSGPGSLRQAIIDANRSPEADTITFNIGTGGTQTINLNSPLPPITEALTIDGTTQGGFAGTPLIVLSGGQVFGDGLTISADNCVVRSLVISGFGGNGIRIGGSNNIIEGNFIGTTPDGTDNQSNFGNGVSISPLPTPSPPPTDNNRIGGTAAAARNLISGNSGNGVEISGARARGNLVQGNFIGTTINGTAALGNSGAGVSISGANDNTIGGTTSGARNLISANSLEFGAGVSISIISGIIPIGANGNLVQGNFIGTDVNGTAVLGNFGAGVEVSASNNTVGGTTPTARNLISGNGENGVSVSFPGGNLIQGNFIGTDVSGAGDAGNFNHGILVTSSENSIGGIVAAAGNVIAFNGKDGTSDGVAVLTPMVGISTGNAILANAIFSNAGLGIDLNDDGVTPNDAGDGDTGSNNLQNFPVLSSALVSTTGTTITGTLNSTANTAFRVEFFLNPTCDSSGNGEGQTFLGATTVTSDAAGNAAFTVNLPTAVPPGQFITATATDAGNNTSEFSQCVQAQATPADLAVIKTASPGQVRTGDDLIYTIQTTNNGPNAATAATLTDAIPANTRFKSITAPTGWTCSAPPVGGSGRVSCTIPSLAPGAVANFTLVVTVDCTGVSGPTTINNTATVSATTLDPNFDNNSASVIVIGAPGATLRLGVAGAGVIENSGTFTLSNNGCAPLIANLTIQRTGPDVTSGKIANDPISLDDSTFFPLRLIGSGGSETPVTFSGGVAQVTLAPNQSATYRVTFTPVIPATAGRTSGLTASQVLPDVVTSQIAIVPQSGAPPLTISLIGRTPTAAQLINPQASQPRKPALIAFTRSGNTLTVDCFVHDPNLDLDLVRYHFLDGSGRPVEAPSDVPVAEAIQRSGLVKGQSFTISQRFSGANERPEIASVRVTIFDRESNDSATSGPVATAAAVVTSVSAASFNDSELASESLAAAFGSELATRTEAANTLPLPTLLGGTSVKIKDRNGIERLAPLFFVSPGQINYLVPRDTALGEATVTVTNRDGVISTGKVQIATSAPGLFAANANGQGVAAAVILRVKADGTQQFEPVAQFDPAQNRFVARPIDFGPATDQLYLLLFGTGIRQRSSLAAVHLQIGGIETEVLYAGAQGDFAGLDQINAPLPRSLAGRGEVTVLLTVDGKIANPVKLHMRGEASMAEASPSVEARPVVAEAGSAPAPRAIIVMPVIELARNRPGRVRSN